MYDEIAARYFSNPESFGEAMTLLGNYDIAARGNWTDTVEPFLSNLTEWQERLLENAIEHNKAKEPNNETIQNNLDVV
tara:strand:+ start:4039 stop:4272 length:234 start_codon:yes stop_codon:yes gene_type:complete